ncbi:MAG: hypothetical protein IJ419_11305 [Agathobacter sp.]|nr:hypothetical protein [Agathobacter sp.]
MKEKITPELLMYSIKAKKKKTAIGVVIGFAAMLAIAAYVVHPFGVFAVLNVLLTILMVAAVVFVIVLSSGHSIISAIKADEIDGYEDEVVKTAFISGAKGTTYYMMFTKYQHPKEPGIIVSDEQYEHCELGSSYYIICVKRTLTNPYILVYPTKDYMLSENLAHKLKG